MKSILLLAAVYSLILHQWHKEKEMNPATAQTAPVNTKTKASAVGQQSYSSATQFIALNTILRVHQ